MIKKQSSATDFGFKASLVNIPGHRDVSMSIVDDDEIVIVGYAMFGVFTWSVFPPFVEDKDFNGSQLGLTAGNQIFGS